MIITDVSGGKEIIPHAVGETEEENERLQREYPYSEGYLHVEFDYPLGVHDE